MLNRNKTEQLNLSKLDGGLEGSQAEVDVFFWGGVVLFLPAQQDDSKKKREEKDNKSQPDDVQDSNIRCSWRTC